ncbi:hypothetical protein BJX65DRAFT_313456 [Aspergillus insuetus]
MNSLLTLLFASSISLSTVLADCNNGERQRCGAPTYGECVWAIAGTCPTECEGTACFPSNDCIISTHQGCAFSCCEFTDRSGCEACAEASGMVATAMCDAIDCQFELEDLADVLDTFEIMWPVIHHD